MADGHKALVRKGASGFARLVPYTLLRPLVRAWALGVAQHEPAGALRRLLQLHDDLYLRIDVAAISYGGGVHVKHDLMRYHDFFVERVAAGERVLDVGCGKAELAYDLVERAGAVVVGLVPMENRDWLVPLRRELGLPHFSDPTHFVEYDERSFVAELGEAGLAVTHRQVQWGELWAEARPR